MNQNDEAVIALGHLVFRLHDAVLSQGFMFDRDFVLGALEDAGLMLQGVPIRACYPLTPLADACVRAYLAKHRNDEEGR